MAKVHWTPKPNQFFPEATVPGSLVNRDFMEKDSKRFADSGGWGYAVLDYEREDGSGFVRPEAQFAGRVSRPLSPAPEENLPSSCASSDLGAPSR
jgi:hypothetical protein